MVSVQVVTTSCVECIVIVVFQALLTHPSTSDISQHERAVVLEYALHWYNKGLLDGDRNGKTELEKNLWLCRIRGTVELQKVCRQLLCVVHCHLVWLMDRNVKASLNVVDYHLGLVHISLAA